MTRPQVSAGTLLLLSVMGCGTPNYRPEPGDATAQLKTPPNVQARICLSGAQAALTAAADGFAAIPAGRPVRFSFQQVDRRGFCDVGARFTPQPGNRYEFVIDAADESCRGNLVVDDPSARIGIRAVSDYARAPKTCSD